MATVSLGFDNFYTSTLSAGITASDTTIYLNALPTATEGYIVIEPDSSTQREIIYYTSKGANFVTLPSAAAGRGVGATTAQSHSSGVTAQMNVVAEHFEALQDGTAISNTAITAAKIANIATNTTAISNPYKFSVYRNAALTINGFTKITWDTEDYDTNNNFTGGTYTVPVTGFYAFTAKADITNAGSVQQRLFLTLYKNGVEIKRGLDSTSPTNTNIVVSSNLSFNLSLTAGNTIEIYAFTSGGLALTVGSANNHFSGYLISQT